MYRDENASLRIGEKSSTRIELAAQGHRYGNHLEFERNVDEKQRNTLAECKRIFYLKYLYNWENSRR